jgi:hypothetical protein
LPPKILPIINSVCHAEFASSLAVILSLAYTEHRRMIFIYLKYPTGAGILIAGVWVALGVLIKELTKRGQGDRMTCKQVENKRFSGLVILYNTFT